MPLPIFLLIPRHMPTDMYSWFQQGTKDSHFLHLPVSAHHKSVRQILGVDCCLQGQYIRAPVSWPCLQTLTPALKVSMSMHHSTRELAVSSHTVRNSWLSSHLLQWFSRDLSCPEIPTSSISRSMHQSTREFAVSSHTRWGCCVRNSWLSSYFCIMPYCFTSFLFFSSKSRWNNRHQL